MNQSTEIPAHVVETISRTIEQHPFHKSCGVNVRHQEPGKSRITFELNSYTLNSAGFLHGGVLYGLMDVGAFAAAITTIAPDEQIVTHDIHCSILAPVTGNASAEIEGLVERKGKSIIFIRVTAYATDDSNERKKIALATVTKSIVKGRFTS